MTTDLIEQTFWSEIEKRGIDKHLEGISKDNIYNWRSKRRTAPTIGDMLNVLYQLNLIKIELHEPTGQPELEQ